MASPLKWLSEALFGKGPPAYVAPQLQSYGSYEQAYEDPGPAPTYQPGEMETRLTGQLQDVIGGQLANYQNGRSLLPDSYRNAILGNARGRIDQNFADSSNQIGEALNRNNLLGGSGHLDNLQRLGGERANALGQYENQFLTQELGMLEGAQRNAMGLRESLQGTFDQRARDRFAGESQAYGMRRQAAQGNYDRARQGVMDRYGAGSDAAQQEYQARVRQSEAETGRRMGFANLAVTAAGAAGGGGSGASAGLFARGSGRSPRMIWPSNGSAEDDRDYLKGRY
jgi:hypothetical protein